MDSVKVRTPQDFESSAPPPAGRTVYAKMACDQCRKRKIRCQTDEQSINDTFPRRKACKQCASLGKGCTWPSEDGRKRPRMTSDGMIPAVTASPAVWTDERSRSDSGLSQHVPYHLMVNPPVQPPPVLASFQAPVYPPNMRQEYPLPNSYGPYDPHYAPTSHSDELKHKNSSLSNQSTLGSAGSTRASGFQHEENGEKLKHTTIQYYRYHGPTALVPGHKKVSLKLNQDCGTTHEDSSTMCHWPSGHDQFSNYWSRSQSGAPLPIFDEATDLPARALLPHLLQSFFLYYGDIFCFINRSILERTIETGEVSSFLLWTICALSSRFTSPAIFTPYFNPKSNGAERERWEYAIPFLEKAKALVPPVISTPSSEAVAGLLFLSWADFGDNNEAGLWTYSGMALRMAQELGLHQERLTDDPETIRFPKGPLGSAKMPTWNPTDRIPSDVFDECNEIVMFWCILVQEICLASGTGRIPGIKRYEITARLPNDTDMAILRAGPGNLIGPVQHEIYPHLIRMMLVYARSTEFLNTDSRQLRTRRPYEEDTDADKAESVKQELIQEYAQLPKDIQYGAIFYRSAVKSGQAAPYLVLHLFYHLHIAFLTQESLNVSEEKSPKGVDEISPNAAESLDPEARLRKTNEDLYRKSIKSIRDMLTLAKLIDGRPLISFFYVNQPFYHTACAYTRDMVRCKKDFEPPAQDDAAFPLPNEVSPSMVFPITPPVTVITKDGQIDTKILPPTSDPIVAEATYTHLQLIAKANYQFARQSIKDQARYYAGAGWVDAALSQRENGLRDVDLSNISEKIATFIRLHGLSGGNLPKKVLKAKTDQLIQDDTSTWTNITPGMLSDAELNFDPQAFFDDYMYTEQVNYGTGMMQ